MKENMKENNKVQKEQDFNTIESIERVSTYMAENGCGKPEVVIKSKEDIEKIITSIGERNGLDMSKGQGVKVAEEVINSVIKTRNISPSAISSAILDTCKTHYNGSEYGNVSPANRRMFFSFMQNKLNDKDNLFKVFKNNPEIGRLIRKNKPLTSLRLFAGSFAIGACFYIAPFDKLLVSMSFIKGSLGKAKLFGLPSSFRGGASR